MSTEPKLGLAGRLAKGFLRSKLTPLMVLASLMLGLLAVSLTPREEEPQIVVPMVDVYVPMPGASPEEVASQVATPLEKRLWGIPGVEYLYSVSRPHMALLTVRFKVNEDQEQSLVKVHQELMSNADVLPSGAMKPIVKLLTIDDVPFLTLTLHGPDQTPGRLRALGEALARELQTVPDTAQVRVVGGARRMVRIEPDPERLRALGMSVADLQPALQTAEAQLPAGALVDRNRRTVVEASGFVMEASELKRLVVAVKNGRPVYLGDVARISDGPEPEPPIVLYGSRMGREDQAVPGTERGGLGGDAEALPAGPAGQHLQGAGGPTRPIAGFEPAVTVALSKRMGTNATALAETVQAKVEALRGSLIPRDLKVEVTRNYGETAGDKSNELIEHLLIATFSVIALILLAMGWRSAVVVGIAVPVTLALTLLISYLWGYTLNRVTLFSLIFSIGILVDDAIVVVENIHRHIHLPGPKRSFARIVIDAVDEVGNPTILATFAVIAAILPMAFVRGLMGPYMRPIPVGASVAMLFSLVIAFVISPWASLKIFRKEADLPGTGAPGHPPEAGADRAREAWSTRLYRRAMHALLTHAKVRWAFFAGVLLLLGGAMALVGFGAVKVKMLPFDNKSEFMVQLDLPAGTPREDALALGQQVARRLLQEPVVRNVQVYAGEAAPFTFVGMVRHSFLRNEAEMVDLQVNLVDKGDRKEQSHDIVVRLRPELKKLPMPEGTRLKLVEIPPGPPVMDTLVAEVYGPSEAERNRYAAQVLQAFREVEGVVDVDSTLNAPSPKLSLVLDREKAALHGIAPAHVVQTLYLAGQGHTAGHFHVQQGSSQVPVVIQLPSAQRDRIDRMLQLTVPGMRGPVPVSDLVEVREGRENAAIHHKNLMPVAYVFGDLGGAIESPVYALAALNKKLDRIPGSGGQAVARLGLAHPEHTEQLVMKWDGEWHITLEVFRDLGLAFAAVLILIYILVVGWFESFEIPWVILVPIPLSLIGIIPAHGLMGAFFTATSMIGFIAGAGIIVRNSIILVDFIELKLKEGMALEAAVEEAGVVRFRPMLLTASAVLVGSAIMLADPIFQGLAISLMAGEVAATLLSRMAVPVLYHLVARRGRAAQLQREGAAERAQ